MDQNTATVNLKNLNPHLLCALCGGYYIDATTIIECLHSFCKTCIVRYLESSKFCPICDVQVHKTKPLQNIRPDLALQNLVYKLVPGLYTRETGNKREFYLKNGANGDDNDGGFAAQESYISLEDDRISIALEFSPNGRPPCVTKKEQNEVLDIRYLLCPAAFNIGCLKKFIKSKFDLSPAHKVEVYYEEEPVCDDYTLHDVAFMFKWRMTGPLKFHYSVYENPAKRRKHSHNRNSTPVTTQSTIKSTSETSSERVTASQPGQTPEVKCEPASQPSGEEKVNESVVKDKVSLPARTVVRLPKSKHKSSSAKSSHKSSTKTGPKSPKSPRTLPTPFHPLLESRAAREGEGEDTPRLTMTAAYSHSETVGTDGQNRRIIGTIRSLPVSIPKDMINGFRGKDGGQKSPDGGQKTPGSSAAPHGSGTVGGAGSKPATGSGGTSSTPAASSPCHSPGKTSSSCHSPGKTSSPCHSPGKTSSSCHSPGKTRLGMNMQAVANTIGKKSPSNGETKPKVKEGSSSNVLTGQNSGNVVNTNGTNGKTSSNTSVNNKDSSKHPLARLPITKSNTNTTTNAGHQSVTKLPVSTHVQKEGAPKTPVQRPPVFDTDTAPLRGVHKLPLARSPKPQYTKTSRAPLPAAGQPATSNGGKADCQTLTKTIPTLKLKSLETTAAKISKPESSKPPLIKSPASTSPSFSSTLNKPPPLISKPTSSPADKKPDKSSTSGKQSERPKLTLKIPTAVLSTGTGVPSVMATGGGTSQGDINSNSETRPPKPGSKGGSEGKQQVIMHRPPSLEAK